jgi:hypothetical protein
MKDLMHAHKWKRGAEETTFTVKEIRRKASLIAPAYNKGALQYLPSAGLSDEPSGGSTRHKGSARE